MASQQKAIVIKGRGDARLVQDAPIPKLRDDYILVQNVAVAINPTDWQHVDGEGEVGAIVGCDYAGTVMEVGRNVKKPFAQGDRVCGFIHGSNGNNHEGGAFAEYVTAKGDLQIPIPNSLSFEEAATLGVGMYDACHSRSLSITKPASSDSTGQATISVAHLRRQHRHWDSRDPIRKAARLLKIFPNGLQYTDSKNRSSNLRVITTCSSRNFPLVKSLGADEAFDYKDPSCGSKIRESTRDELKHAIDTISIDASAKICADALSATGGIYSALEPIGCPREDVESKSTLAYTATGEDLVDYGRPASKEDFEFGVMFWKLAEQLLEQGRLKVHPPRVKPEGLKGVLEGMQEMRQGKVSGEKLVYRIADTP
ncbi:MAG: hypothetical protein M1836_005110 [Candelina mexicana]|nr:MAG: hypothetical protein M1836_005110 [Candelina mexicana]